MDATIECGQCKNRMTVDTSLAGKHVQCPSCGEVVTVPADLQSGFPVEKPDDYIFCRQCGTRNAGNNFKCTQCGTVLHLPPQPGYVISDDMSMGGLIPYKNPKALWAYYLGIFSLFPMLGFPLGVYLEERRRLRHHEPAWRSTRLPA